MSTSALEAQLAAQLAALNVPEPEREYRFAPPRRWRGDFAWPLRRVMVEVEGGVFARGRHTRGAGYQKDTEKHNAAALAGWLLLRYTAPDIRSGRAAGEIAAALAVRSAAGCNAPGDAQNGKTG